MAYAGLGLAAVGLAPLAGPALLSSMAENTALASMPLVGSVTYGSAAPATLTAAGVAGTAYAGSNIVEAETDVNPIKDTLYGGNDKMVESGKVQMSGDNKVHVANPADINSFGKQAPKGSLYVEFDVPDNTISKGGTDGWGIINGPGSLFDRYNVKKGLPGITERPNATNITIRGSK